MLLLNASGCLDALAAPDVARSLDAFVTKTVTPEPREGNPPVRIAETEAGMLNSIGLANPGRDYFLSTSLPALRGGRAFQGGCPVAGGCQLLLGAAQGITPGTIVNASRSICCGPGINNWDVSFSKQTAIGEKMNLEFRADIFNLWNHAQFYTVDGNISNQGGTFGQVLHIRDPRLTQFALKLRF